MLSSAAFPGSSACCTHVVFQHHRYHVGAQQSDNGIDVGSSQGVGCGSLLHSQTLLASALAQVHLNSPHQGPLSSGHLTSCTGTHQTDTWLACSRQSLTVLACMRVVELYGMSGWPLQGRTPLTAVPFSYLLLPCAAPRLIPQLAPLASGHLASSPLLLLQLEQQPEQPPICVLGCLYQLSSASEGAPFQKHHQPALLHDHTGSTGTPKCPHRCARSKPSRSDYCR